MRCERFLTQADAATLSRLAEQLLRVRDVKFNVAERLIELIASSILLPENAVRPDCVSLQSTVTYRQVGPLRKHRNAAMRPSGANATPKTGHNTLLGRPVGSIVEARLPFNQIQYVEIVEVQRDVFPRSATGANTDRIGGYRGTHL